jgi:hypothetical protein
MLRDGESRNFANGYNSFGVCVFPKLGALSSNDEYA